MNLWDYRIILAAPCCMSLWRTVLYCHIAIARWWVGADKALSNILVQRSCPPPPPPPPVEGRPDRPVLEELSRSGAREVRKRPFGPWSISKVFADGCFVAWGANCNSHTNKARCDQKCKRQIGFRGGCVSEADARCRVKLWLLAGRAILRTNPCGRDAHLNVDPHMLALRPEEEIDAEAASLL